MNFDRILYSIGVDRMQLSKVVIIGAQPNLARNLVRCGLGHVVSIDFDRTGPENLQRQDYSRADIGRPKGEVVGREVLGINPDVEVQTYDRDFCEMSSDEVQEIVGDSDLLIGATDSFWAQARVNLEAVRLGIPALWIGLYRLGRAGEIIYYVPGLTACFRCVASSRYAAFAAGRASVPSEGGTIFDLQIVDAIGGQIAVGILTRGAPNRYGRLIDQLGNRNLLQVKIDPEYRLGDKDIFKQYLGDHPAQFSFSTIALPMEVDPECPDCAPVRAEGLSRS